MLEFLVTFVLPIAVFVGLVNFILWIKGLPIMDSNSSRYDMDDLLRRKRLDDDLDDMSIRKHHNNDPFDHQ